MAKYINADELIKFCTSMLVEAKDDEIIQTHNNAFRHMREHIKSLPSADVVDVVRCKDCKYFDVDGVRGRPVDGQEVRMCKKFYNYPFMDNEYCSRGERRESEC